jgi:hypothetical protein
MRGSWVLTGMMLWAAVAFGAEGGGTTLEAVSQVPVDQDACLDHTVRELGMSAKKAEPERRWVIGSQFLHSAVAKVGTLGVRFEKGERTTQVRVTATWPGEKKPAAVQEEMESRISSMVWKMAQLCGVTRPEVKCEVKDAAGKATACTGKP